MLWFGPGNWSSWPKTKSQPGAFRGRRKGPCAQSDSARCQLSSLMWVSPCKWQMGVFSANVHLSKTLTSDAQALLVNNDISGSCPSAQLWALSLSTGFHSIQEQGYGDPHASPSGYPLLLCWPPASVNPLISVFPSFRNLQMKSQQHSPIFRTPQILEYAGLVPLPIWGLGTA